MKHDVAVWTETGKSLASMMIPLELDTCRGQSGTPTLRNCAQERTDLGVRVMRWGGMRSIEGYEYEVPSIKPIFTHQSL